MGLRNWRIAAAIAACLWPAVWGCSSGPERELPPGINPVDAGKAAITEYDTNHDGVISGEELKKCPALKRALSRYDTGGDGKVTADNIAARVQKWQEAKSAVTKLGILVNLDGRGLADATVTAEPEKFLGPDIKPATGVTDSSGSIFTLAIPGKAGTSFGLYKLKVSKIVDGKETIPPRYNSATELGVEVAPDVPELKSGGITLDLKSRG